MSKKRYDPAAAARRTQDFSVPLTAATVTRAPDGADRAVSVESATGALPGSTGPEYLKISVWKIDPAPWQSRIVFQNIEELADSIRGDGMTEGVGIVEPILVREMPEGRYQLIDGERRWRAAKLIAHERADGDLVMPARLFHVSDRIGQLIGQAANEERDQPKPLERALAYRRLREALEQESPGETIGVRKVAGIGWHKRSQVRDYLAIAERLTPEVLRAAGVVDEGGRVEEKLVTKLSVTDLLAVANADTDEERVAALRAKADRVRGIKTPSPVKVEKAAALASPAERLAQMRDSDGLSIRVRAPLRSLAPAAAQQLVTNELVPAMLVLVEQGQGHAQGEGYFGDFRGEHTMLVLPREVEGLSAAQLEALSRDVATLAKRVRRAVRFRRGRQSVKSPSGGTPTP